MNGKIKFSAILMVLLLAAGWTGAQTVVRSDFQAESKMWVDGTSSVHDFTCQVSKVGGGVELSVNDQGVVDGVLKTGVNVAVGQIECKNGTMNDKLRKALKADKNPTIKFELDQADVLSGATASAFKLKASGKLTMAGTTKPIQVDVTGQRLADGRYRLQGSRTLLMSDYGITPPTAMMGALKTGNQVTVRFDVVTAPAAAL